MTPVGLYANTASATDLGRKRSTNEDSHELWTPDGRETAGETLLVVCDGMGGSNAGEVASRMAVDAVVRVYSERRSGGVSEALREAVETANREVWEHTRSRPDLEGMGTTCTVLLLRDGSAHIAHVGDSRAYLIRGGHIRQLTHDHTLVAQLVDRHQLSPEEARTDSRRNVVTRSVGVNPQVEVELGSAGEDVQAGDTFLLCSDGLHGQVTDLELARIGARDSLDRACRELVALANQRGGPDNITVLLARMGSSVDRAPAGPGRERSAPAPAARQRTLTLLIAALIVLLLALGGLAWVVAGKMRTASNLSASRAGGETTNR